MMPQSQHHLVARRSAELAEQLRDLARRVRALSPCRRDPERYHLEKDEIEKELARLARAAGGGGGRP